MLDILLDTMMLNLAGTLRLPGESGGILAADIWNHRTCNLVSTVLCFLTQPSLTPGT